MKRWEKFYLKRMEEENWTGENIIDDPPTDPRLGMHILIEELLGKDWYVSVSETDDQVITAAIADIIQIYVDGVKEGKKPNIKKMIWWINHRTLIYAAAIMVVVICAAIGIGDISENVIAGIIFAIIGGIVCGWAVKNDKL